MVKVSIVVPTYNRRELLKECLDSLFNQTYPKDEYEVIVVDDGSTDGTEELLKEYAKNAPCTLKYFKQENRGPAAARNAGIKHAAGDIVCFLDDDCIADKNWIMNMVDKFNEDKVGGVGGKIIVTPSDHLIEPKIDQSGLINTWSSLSGCNMAFKKDILDDINGFDPLFRFGAEDNDICIRVRLKGYTLKYAPEAIVFLRHSTTLGDLIKKQYNYGIGCSRLGKKYTDFPFKNLVFFITIKLMWNFTSLPVKVMLTRNRKCLVKELLNILQVFAYLIGMIKGYLFENYPKEKVISAKLHFLGVRDKIKLLERVKTKI